MENTLLIRMLHNHQHEGFEELYTVYSDRVFKYIYHVVNDRLLAVRLLHETFSKIHQERPVINYNTGSIFTWLIEETIQVILENCPEKSGEIRKQLIRETHLLNITEAGDANQFSIQYLVVSPDQQFRHSA